MVEASIPAFLPAAGGYGVNESGRALWRAGIPVFAPRYDWSSQSTWSRAITGTVDPRPPYPSLETTAAWLLSAGERLHGAVLMPVLDDVSYLAAENRAALSQHWRLYYPSGETMLRLLDKATLDEDARAAGLATPGLCAPATPDDVAAARTALRFPVVIKPRAHVGMRHWRKGLLVERPAGLKSAYALAAAEQHFDPEILERRPSLALPVIQEVIPGAWDRIYNLSGFIDPARGIYAVRASRKLLQKPRRFGVGLAFEPAPVDDEVAARLRELLTTAGFHGMFEAEFADADGQFLLLDLNPRTYNGMGLAHAQGLRLALAWYHAALDDWASVEEDLHAPEDPRLRGLAHPFLVRTMVLARLASGRMGPREALGWERWLRGGGIVNAVSSKDDPWPRRLDTLLTLYSFARDPRATAGTFLKD